MDYASSMAQPENITRAASLGKDRLDRELDSLVAKVAQERIARAQRQKCQRGPLAGRGLGKETIHNFVRRAIAPDRDEVADTAIVGGAGEFAGLSRRTG